MPQHTKIQTGSIGQNDDLGLARPAVGLQCRLHELLSLTGPLSDPRESPRQDAIALDSTRNDVVLIKTGVEVGPNVGTVDSDGQSMQSRIRLKTRRNN
jgi:hypothetical protein